MISYKSYKKEWEEDNLERKNMEVHEQLPISKEKKTNIFGGVLSLLFAVAGIVCFFSIERWIGILGIVGAIFVSLYGTYLIAKN